MPLTWAEARKSWTIWASVLVIAAPEIWETLVTDPALHIPPGIKHAVTLAGAIFVIIARVRNSAGYSVVNSQAAPMAPARAEGPAAVTDVTDPHLP